MKIMITGASVLALAGCAFAADQSLSGIGTDNGAFYNFDGFTGAGFAPEPGPGQLDSDNWIVRGLSEGDLDFGGTGDAGDFARGTSPGGTTTGGAYSFEHNPGDFSLGVQPTGSDFTPGEFVLRLQNTSALTLNQLEVVVERFVNNDQERANSFDLSWSLNDVDYSGLDLFTSGEASDTEGFVGETVFASIGGFSLDPGAFIYLRWAGDDVSGGGSRDEFALDNVRIFAIPTPGVAGLLGVAGLGFMRRRR